LPSFDKRRGQRPGDRIFSGGIRVRSQIPGQHTPRAGKATPAIKSELPCYSSFSSFLRPYLLGYSLKRALKTTQKPLFDEVFGVKQRRASPFRLRLTKLRFDCFHVCVVDGVFEALPDGAAFRKVQANVRGPDAHHRVHPLKCRHPQDSESHRGRPASSVHRPGTRATAVARLWCAGDE